MRIGLIGAGAVAPFHARAAALIAGTRLTAVCDLDPVIAARTADPAGAQVFTDYRALLDSGLVDAVIVNTPHSLHRAMVVDAAACGLHVLVEKPLATTLADCDAMIEACRAAGVRLVVGHIQHFLPDKVAAAAVLRAGDLGPVRMVHDLRSTDYRPGTRPDWFFSRTVAGGGALMNIGAHCLDRTVWLTGAPVESISAAVATRFGVGVETDGVMQVRHRDSTSSVSVVSAPPEAVDEITVVGELGTVTANPRTGTFCRRAGEVETLYRPDPDAIPDAFHAQLADFVDVVGGAEPTVTLAHSRHVVELVLAAYRSARTGLPVGVGAEPASLAAAGTGR